MTFNGSRRIPGYCISAYGPQDPPLGARGSDQWDQRIHFQVLQDPQVGASGTICSCDSQHVVIHSPTCHLEPLKAATAAVR